MALIFNNTTIAPSYTVKYNNTAAQVVRHNNVTVWQKKLVLWDGTNGVSWSTGVNTPNAGAANGDGGIDGSRRQYAHAYVTSGYFCVTLRYCTVDLTPYTKLRIQWMAASNGPNYSGQMYGVGIDLSGGWNQTSSWYIGDGGSTDATFNIASLTGSHSICARAQSSNAGASDVWVYISQAWLE